MIRSQSIPSVNRNTVQPAIPLLLCVPCASYSRPSSTRERSKSITPKSNKLIDAELKDLFVNGKNSICEKSVMSSNITLNSNTSRTTYTTAELNRFKNSLAKSGLHKRMTRSESNWSPMNTVMASNMSNLNSNSSNENHTPRKVNTAKNQPQLTFIYDPIQHPSTVNSSKTAAFNIFRSNLIKTSQQNCRRPSALIMSNFFSHQKDISKEREKDSHRLTDFRLRLLKKLY